MNPRYPPLFAALIGACFSPAAAATLMVGEFTAVVTQLNDTSGTGPDSNIVGELFSGIFRYESEPPADANCIFRSTSSDCSVESVGTGYADINFEIAGILYDVTPESKSASTSEDLERVLIIDEAGGGEIDRFQLNEYEGGSVRYVNGDTYSNTERATIFVRDTDYEFLNGLASDQEFDWNASHITRPDDEAFGVFSQFEALYSYDEVTEQSSRKFIDVWTMIFDIQSVSVRRSVPVSSTLVLLLTSLGILGWRFGR